MATVVVFSDVNDSFVRGDNATYATARVTGTAVFSSAVSALQCGQRFTAGTYRCDQALLAFDTRMIKGPVTSATFAVYISSSGNLSTTDFIAECRLYDWGTDPEIADFVSGDNLASKTLLATLDTSTIVNDQLNTFTDTAFAAGVEEGNYTRVIIASDRQRTAVPPVGDELIAALQAELAGTTQDPQLSIVYSPAREAYISGDRVRETTTTTGTGDVTLAGAASGCQAFSAIATTWDRVAYEINGTTEWEVGIGIWRTGNILQRSQVLASSNSGALVNFSAGTKDVCNTFPAQSGALAMTSMVQPTASYVPPSTGLFMVDEFEVTAALELGVNAVLEIS